MNKRQDLINKIEDIAVITDATISSGSWQVYLLKNPLTADECQIFEAVDGDGKGLSMPYHIHGHSRELFYQVRGETRFSDGDVLGVGQSKIIGIAEAHSATLMPSSACIIIVHPIEPLYPRGN
jgi:hypothetical protein